MLTLRKMITFGALAMAVAAPAYAFQVQATKKAKVDLKWFDAKMTTLDAKGKTFMVIENRTGGSGSGGADITKMRDVRCKFDPQKTNAHFKGETRRLTWADIQVIHNLMQRDGQDPMVRIYHAADKSIKNGEVIDATEMVIERPTARR